MNILLTGGAGFIGSHTAVALLEAGHRVVIVDNFANSSRKVIGRIESISKISIPFSQADVRDASEMERVLRQHRIDAVFHFAGLKAVGESVIKPLEYFDNNVNGTVALLSAMRKVGVSTFIFSSSATVYGEPRYLPLDESHPTSALNPYGRTKLHIEEVLRDLAASDSSWRICALRYFNPVGAHPSGLIGEDPRGIPNNLMPFIARVAAGALPSLQVFGNDYPTDDGTGVRDYIHVMDLADGHIAAFNRISRNDEGVAGFEVFNLGTGRGFSVLQMVHAFEAASGMPVPYRIAPRRPGDSAECFADPSLALKLLEWRAVRGLEEMCESTWRFQRQSGASFPIDA